MNATITLLIVEEDSNIELHLNIPDDAPDCIAVTLSKQLLEIANARLNEIFGQDAKVTIKNSH
jgi:hypothetical protein